MELKTGVVFTHDAKTYIAMMLQNAPVVCKRCALTKSRHVLCSTAKNSPKGRNRASILPSKYSPTRLSSKNR